MSVTPKLADAERSEPSVLPSGATIALASLLGGAVAAGLTMLLTPDTLRLRPRPLTEAQDGHAETRARAEDAIQRTLEGRSF